MDDVSVFGRRFQPAGLDVTGNTERFTREIGDRLGLEERLSNRKTRGLIPSLLTGNVLS